MQNAFKDRDTPEKTGEKLGQYAESAMEEGEKNIKRAASETRQKFREGQEQLGDFVDNIDDQLHENPWPVVAGVAVGCLLVGFIMGSKTRS